MNTEEIMDLACSLAGVDEVPKDSDIYVPGENIKKVLFGIDIGTAELKIAKDLGYDLVIAHHPVANPGYHSVFLKHIPMMVKHGIPEEEAKEAVAERMQDLSLNNSVANHDHVVSIAELLDIPFMNIHQPSDELGRQILQERVDNFLENNPEATVGELIDDMSEIPEFKYALTDIKLRMGDLDNKAGKVIVSHGALSNGGYQVATKYFQHGFDTVIYIRIAPNDLRRLQADNLGNFIDAGHIAFDELGVSPLIDALRERGLVVDAISGLRYRRNHGK